MNDAVLRELKGRRELALQFQYKVKFISVMEELKRRDLLNKKPIGALKKNSKRWFSFIY